MATNNNAPATKVIVPCRISFANIWEPKSINGSDEKYSVSLLIPKDDKATLATEYFRDVNKGLPIEVPKNYFRNDDPDEEILFRWRSHANLLFSNWLNYYLYQATPYNLDDLRDGKADAWRATSGEE